MIPETAIEKIEKLANEVALREGVQLYDVEFVGGGQGRTLRISIDKEGGVGVDDCANVSRGLNLLLDVEDPIPGGKYYLEVSSPGLERPLKKAWHFEKAQGKKIWVKTAKAFEAFGCTLPKIKAAKQISDVLMGLEGENLRFQVEGQDLLIPLSQIEKAKMVFDFKQGKNSKNPHQRDKNK